MKRVYKDKRRRSTGHQPGRKSVSRLADEPVVNRGFCFSIALKRVSLVRASGKTFRRRVFDALEGAREACLPGEQLLLASNPARPRPAIPPCALTRPARVMSVFWTRQSYDFACSCFWGDIQATSHRCLEGYEGRLLPGRTVLPDPAPPLRAPTRPARCMSGF